MADKELRTNLRISGENAVKQGIKGVREETSKAGKEFKEMGQEADLLNAKIKALQASSAELVREFARTGGNPALRKEIRQEQRQLRELERFKKMLPDPALPLSPPVGSGMLAGKPAVMGAGALLAADALPFLGGVIASAVVGGVGIGGIAGGIALAAQDSRVQSAASALGDQLGPAFMASAEPLVQPTIDALKTLGAEGGTVAADLRAGFASVAPAVNSLTNGLTGLVHEMMPGLLKTFEASRPVIRVIAAELPKIGGAVGDFLSDVSDDTDGAVLAFHALSEIIQGTVRSTGKVISVLSEAYEWSVRTGQKAAETGEEIFSWIPGFGYLAEKALGGINENLKESLRALDEANRETGDFSQSTSKLTVVQYGLGVALDGSTEALEAQRQAMHQLVNLELDSVGHVIALERAFDAFSESAKENGRSLLVSDEAGRRNLETVRAAIEEVIAAAEVERNLALAHGATAKEADDAARAYRDTYAKALEQAAIAAFGNTGQLQKMLDLLDQLDGKRVTYTLVQRGGVTVGAKVPGGFIPSGFEERATGGPVLPNRDYVVGENGIEILRMGSSGGHVFNNSQTTSMLSGASGGASRPQVHISVGPSGDPAWDALVQAMWPAIARQIRIDGGDLASIGQ